MTESSPPAVIEPAALKAVVVEPAGSATMEQISSAELADLRKRAARYRFLFKTIVTVTTILAVAVLGVVIVALGFD